MGHHANPKRPAATKHPVSSDRKSAIAVTASRAHKLNAPPTRGENQSPKEKNVQVIQRSLIKSLGQGTK